jgi:hypothetical protein
MRTTIIIIPLIRLRARKKRKKIQLRQKNAEIVAKYPIYG